MPRGPKPKADIDQIEQLAAIGCTWKEIASILKISESAISKNKKYSSAIDRGRQHLCSSIRKKQYEIGVKHGNVKMLIWLGKQYLQQSDRQNIETKTEFTASGESPRIIVQLPPNGRESKFDPKDGIV